MEDYFPAPDRRFPSPSAQRRNGEHWKARVGLGFVILLTLVSAAIMFRIAGLGVGTATSALRGGNGSPPRPPAAATVPAAGGQQPGSQPAAAPAGNAQAAPAAAAPGAQAANPPAASAVAPAAQAPAGAAPPAAQAQPTAPPVQPSPTTRPNQREHTIAAGDSLWAISQRYGTTVDAIVAANNLPGRNANLRVGQVLVIPA